jgi:hypothetical protein
MTRQNTENKPSFDVIVKHFNISVPTVTEPAWAASVARWHQLDEATCAVVEAAYRFSQMDPELWGKVWPKSIWLAAAGGSNKADYEFVLHGSRSPSRFVGTLPSIRSSSLALFMNWSGPVMCVQSGETTLVQGLDEVYWHLRDSEVSSTWLITSTRSMRDNNPEYIVSFFCFGSGLDGDFLLSSSEKLEHSICIDHLNLVAQSKNLDQRKIDIGLQLTLSRKSPVCT